MKRVKSEGNGIILGIVCILLVTVVVFASLTIVRKNDKSKQMGTDSSFSTAGDTGDVTPSKQSTTSSIKYLDIKELGVRLKLPDEIGDAYYFVVPSESENGEFFAYLSAHSLDPYPECRANKESGIAALASFKEGATNPVTGDFATVYPNSSKISDRYYYIQGNQFDCTLEKNTDLYSQVRQAFIRNTEIQKIPE